MGIKIPTYESQVGIGSANAGQAASYQKASAFVSPGQEGMPQALNHLAGGMNKLAGVVFNEEIRQRQEQLELDLLNDLQGVHAATAAFQDEYTSTYKGAGARDAAQQAAAFNDAQLGPLREKYGHNKTALSYIERRGGELALNNLNAMRDYSTTQGEVYKDSVFAGEQALARNALEDWRTPPDKWQAVEGDIRAKAIGYAQSKGLDSTAAGAQLDAFIRDAREKREKSRLEYLIQTNPAEAERYIKGNSTVGGPADFAARRESGGDIRAIGYDRTGGTSYGTFQMSSKAGTAGNFLDYLSAKGGVHAEAAAQIRAAGELDGGKDGAAALAWKGAVESGAITREMEEQFIQETHVTPALAAMNPAMQKAVEADPRLQKAVFSTAVQHGAGGAQRLMGRAWEKADGDTDTFLKALYADRKTQFGSSTPEVQAAAAKRMDAELSELLDPAAGAPDTELARALPPEIIAGYEAKAGAALLVEQKRVSLARAKTVYDGIQTAVAAYPTIEEQETAAFAMVDGVADDDARHKMKTWLQADFAIKKTQQKANDMALGRQLMEYAKAEGYNLVQTQQVLAKSKEFSPAGREYWEKRLGQEAQRETPENRKGLDTIRAAIDRGEIETDDQFQAACLNTGITDRQIAKAESYRQSGGNKAAVKISTVQRIAKSYFRTNTLPAGFYDAFVESLPPGKEMTEAELKKHFANVYMQDGEIEEHKGTSWYRGVGHGPDEPYWEAVRQGPEAAASWLPDVTKDEEREYSAVMRSRGVQVTPEKLRLYKKHDVMGLPVPDKGAR